ncbi:MAG: peptidoglycan DD-metalloendopeptidase family protein, partial [Firmicutes bacterium]|nr:peptidoglycan DD-metalloendopeptidase family protein [Bacillota bacterium]
MKDFSDKDGKKINNEAPVPSVPDRAKLRAQRSEKAKEKAAEEAAAKEAALKEARRNIREQARQSRRKVRELTDKESFEATLQRRDEARAAERRERRRKRALRKAAAEGTPVRIDDENEEILTAYKAKASLQKHQQKKYGEGAVHRLWRLFKTLRQVRSEIEGDVLITNEKRRAAYAAAFQDCCSPVYLALRDAVDTAWSFLSSLARDAWDVVLFLCDLVIAAAYYIGDAALKLWDHISDLRYTLDLHKGTVFQVFATTVAACVLGVVFFSSLVGYEYSYYGKPLGIAKSKEDVYNTIQILGDKLSSATGAKVSLDVERDIQFTRTIGFNQDIDSPDDILDTLTYMTDIQVLAYAITVDGEDTVILQSEDAAWRVLENIKSDYMVAKLDTDYLDSFFVEDISVNEVSVKLGDIWNTNQAKRYLMTGTVNAVALETDQPLLTVVTEEEYTYYEPIAYGTTYIDNASLYTDETELVSAGIYGQQENKALIVRYNGVETDQVLISSIRVSEPVSEVYYKGTKKIPELSGSGTFSYPMRTYTITSRFGIRWGRMHEGVDFAAAIGTKIYASDGGTVTFSGWKDGYGYVIIIDHGGLYESRYAHCSKLLVEEGEQVYQGQNIALCGSTGRSTGPHLHFEIRYKGEANNPLD